MVSTWVARTIRLRIEYFWSERTNSVRSRGTRGSLAPRPRIISMSASASRAWAMRPPQKVSSPVISTRLPMAQPNQMLRRSRSMSWRESCMRGPDALGLVHHPAPRVPLEARFDVEGDGIEDPELDLDREVGDVARSGPSASELTVTGK